MVEQRTVATRKSTMSGAMSGADCWCDTIELHMAPTESISNDVLQLPANQLNPRMYCRARKPVALHGDSNHRCKERKRRIRAVLALSVCHS